MIVQRSGHELNLAEVRRELRQSLVRRLRTNPPTLRSTAKGGVFWLSDLAAVRWFAGITIHHGNEIEAARLAYDELRTVEPTWQELFDHRWVRESAGRVWVTELGEHAFKKQNLPALQDLHQKRFRPTFALADELRSDPELAPIAASIDAGTATPFDVGCQSPAWVAARLWETVSQPATQSDLLQWLTKWHDLGWPEFTPTDVWQPEVAAAFINLSLSAIEETFPANGWIELARDVELRNAEVGVTRSMPLPDAALDRLQWLERLHWIHDQIAEDSSMLYLVGIVLRQIAQTDYSAVPYEQANRLFSLALERPAVLNTIWSWCVSLPVLLADMIICAPICAIACAIIGESPRAYTNYITFAVVDDVDRDRETSFRDALTVLETFISNGQASATDVASLFTWAIDEHGSDFTSRRPWIRDQLRGLAQRMSPEHVRAVLSVLFTDATFELATSAYIAALEIVGATSPLMVQDADAIITGYVKS